MVLTTHVSLYQCLQLGAIPDCSAPAAHVAAIAPWLLLRRSDQSSRSCLAVAADVRAALQRDSGVSTAQARERGGGVRPWAPAAPHAAAAAPQLG